MSTVSGSFSTYVASLNNADLLTRADGSIDLQKGFDLAERLDFNGNGDLDAEEAQAVSRALDIFLVTNQGSVDDFNRALLDNNRYVFGSVFASYVNQPRPDNSLLLYTTSLYNAGLLPPTTDPVNFNFIDLEPGYRLAARLNQNNDQRLDVQESQAVSEIFSQFQPHQP